MLIARDRNKTILDLRVEASDELALFARILEISLSPIEVKRIRIYFGYMEKVMICMCEVWHRLVSQVHFNLWHWIRVLGLHLGRLGLLLNRWFGTV